MVWHLFPVRDKIPMVRGGWHSASPDPEQWARWAPRAHGWALALQPSGLLAIDVDPRNGGFETLLELPPLEPTLTARTRAGGLHAIYQADPGARFRGSLGRGIDVKHRGYIQIAPTDGYSWFDLREPAELPEWLLPRLLVVPRPVQESIGTAGGSPLAALFEARGLLGRVIDDERVCVTCPWADEHSQKGSDSGTIVFPPTESEPWGRFFCSHTSHGPKGVLDILETLGIGQDHEQ